MFENIDSYGRMDGGEKYKNTIITFHMKQTWAQRKGEPKGEAKEVLYVKKQPIGDPKTLVDKPATEMDKELFKEQYEKFLKGEEMKQKGMPLEDWREIPEDLVLMLKSNGVHTVEVLSDLPDTTCQRIGRGILDWKYRAASYCENQFARVTEVENENKELKARLEALEKKMGMAPEKKARPKKEQPRKKAGRPRKVKADDDVNNSTKRAK